MPNREIAGPQGRLVADDRGVGEPPVVFVHADAGNLGQWARVLEHVAESRRAVALDLRGHGGSAPAADGDYSYAGRAEDVVAVMDALVASPAVVVGHSGGGVTALHFAAQHPERVRALLLVDPATDGRAMPDAQKREFLDGLRSDRGPQLLHDYYASIAGPNAEVRDQVLADAAHTSMAAVAGTFEALGTYDPGPALRGYRGPRLSVVSPITADALTALHHIDPTLPHRTLAGTGHWVHLDAPDAFLAILDEFLAAVPPEG